MDPCGALKKTTKQKLKDISYTHFLSLCLVQVINMLHRISNINYLKFQQGFKQKNSFSP